MTQGPGPGEDPRQIAIELRALLRENIALWRRYGPLLESALAEVKSRPHFLDRLAGAAESGQLGDILSRLTGEDTSPRTRRRRR